MQIEMPVARDEPHPAVALPERLLEQLEVVQT